MNDILTIDMITRMAVRIWKNTNYFIQNINTQYDDQYARDGAKIGSTLRIRLPNQYTVADGPAAQVQDTNEKQITMTLATQRHVDVSFTTAERTMKLDDYVERILAPKVSYLTANVARTIIESFEGGVSNAVANKDGSGNVIHPTQFEWLEAGAVLANNSAPPGQQKIVIDPNSQAVTVSSLTGLLNPAPEISRQYREGAMYDALGFKWYKDQTVIKHTTGTFSAGGGISGADQNNTAILTVAAITGTLKAGDIITIADVMAVNRLTYQSLGVEQQFVVTDDVSNGGTSISIYPALVAPPVGQDSVQYQTVDAAPANGAAISLYFKPSEVIVMNMAYAPDAFTMAVADLELPEGVWERSRAMYDGVSLRSVLAYAPGTDQVIDRLDVLFGSLCVRGEWAVIVADSVG